MQHRVYSKPRGCKREPDKNKNTMTEENEIGNFLEFGWFKVILAIGENVLKVNVTFFDLKKGV